MRIKHLVSSMILCLLGTGVMVAPLPGAALLQEHFSSASIDTALWHVEPACCTCTDPIYTTVMELRHLGGGDFAFLTRGPDSWNETVGSEGFTANRWNHALAARTQFARGNNIRCTFTFWGDPTNPAWMNRAPASDLKPGPIAFPTNTCLNGPWKRHNHSETCSTIYNTGEAHIGCSSFFGGDFGFEQSGSWGSPNFASEAFVAAFGASDGKKFNALMARIWLGDTDGAMWEWSSDFGQTWITEYDNRDTGEIADPAADVWIAFATDMGAVFLDDIIVEDDSNLVVATPTPEPIPDPDRGTWLYEDWNSGQIRPDVWDVDLGDATQPMYIVEDADGNQALRMWNVQGDENDANGVNWSGSLYSVPSFPRGNNLRCTFDVWGGSEPWPEDVADSTRGAGLEGPFHWNNFDSAQYLTLAAGSLMWYNWDGTGAGPLWAHGARWGDNTYDSTQAFKTALEAAIGRENALNIRVTMADVLTDGGGGALYEWSSDGGETWNQEADRREDSEAVGHSQFHIGFIHIFPAWVYIDNIAVENDDHILTGPPVNAVVNWVLY